MAAVSSASAALASSNSGNGANYRGSSAIMTSLPFLGGFMTLLNDLVKRLNAWTAGTLTERL
jgi:hypothetical protein